MPPISDCRFTTTASAHHIVIPTNIGGTVRCLDDSDSVADIIHRKYCIQIAPPPFFFLSQDLVLKCIVLPADAAKVVLQHTDPAEPANFVVDSHLEQSKPGFHSGFPVPSGAFSYNFHELPRLLT